MVPIRRIFPRELLRYWQTQYDWREQEAKLNQFAQFRADIDGFGVHFIHERGTGPKPLPIILLHGWRDSFFRMVKVLPLLTDPARNGGDPVFDSRLLRGACMGKLVKRRIQIRCRLAWRCFPSITPRRAKQRSAS